MSDAYASMYGDNSVEQIDEVAPLIAGLAGKAAGALAGKVAAGGAAKVGGGLAKAASSKLGKAAINAGSNAVGSKVERKMSEESEESYTAAYMEAYKNLPVDKMEKQQKGKSKDGDGPAQARKMEVVRKATQGSEGMVKDAVKGQEMSNKKKGLEKRFNAPSANKSNKNKAYELEGQRRRDLDKRYGPKKEEAEVVLELLIDEGVAIDNDAAYDILTHMSDEWFQTILEAEADKGVDADEAMKRHGIKPHEGTMKVTKLKPRKMRKGEGLGVGARKRQGAGKVSAQNPNNYQKGEKLN